MQSNQTSTSRPQGKPRTGRRYLLHMYYQHLQVGPVNTTIRLLYNPNPDPTSSCGAKYRVGIYRSDTESPESEFETIDSTQKTIIIPSQYINGTTFLRLFVLDANNSTCETSKYFYNLISGKFINRFSNEQCMEIIEEK